MTFQTKQFAKMPVCLMCVCVRTLFPERDMRNKLCKPQLLKLAASGREDLGKWPRSRRKPQLSSATCPRGNSSRVVGETARILNTAPAKITVNAAGLTNDVPPAD